MLDVDTDNIYIYMDIDIDVLDIVADIDGHYNFPKFNIT